VRAREDGAIAWICAGWNALVLVPTLQRNFGAGARSSTSLPVKPSTSPSVSEEVELVTASAAGMRRFNLKSVYVLLKASISNWTDDFAPSMGAALAYYTVFSIAPLLVIAIAVAALVFGQSTAQHEILDQIRGLVGSEGANAIESMLIRGAAAVGLLWGRYAGGRGSEQDQHFLLIAKRLICKLPAMTVVVAGRAVLVATALIQCTSVRNGCNRTGQREGYNDEQRQVANLAAVQTRESSAIGGVDQVMLGVLAQIPTGDHLKKRKFTHAKRRPEELYPTNWAIRSKKKET
jgi:hypothetical protein